MLAKSESLQAHIRLLLPSTAVRARPPCSLAQPHILLNPRSSLPSTLLIPLEATTDLACPSRRHCAAPGPRRMRQTARPMLGCQLLLKRLQHWEGVPWRAALPSRACDTRGRTPVCRMARTLPFHTLRTPPPCCLPSPNSPPPFPQHHASLAPPAAQQVTSAVRLSQPPAAPRTRQLGSEAVGQRQQPCVVAALDAPQCLHGGPRQRHMRQQPPPVATGARGRGGRHGGARTAPPAAVAHARSVGHGAGGGRCGARSAVTLVAAGRVGVGGGARSAAARARVACGSQMGMGSGEGAVGAVAGQGGAAWDCGALWQCPGRGGRSSGGSSSA